MPSRWVVGTSTGPLLRQCPARTLLFHTNRSEDRICLILPTTFRRTHVNRTQPPHPSTSSQPNGDEPSEKTGLKSGLGPSASVYLDTIQTRLRERASLLSSAATLSLAEIGGRLNKFTGYEHIERLKHKVVDAEVAITARRQASRDAKAAYETAVARRSHSQREVNDLLQRKSTWLESDLSRFTSMVREDHQYEQEEANAKARVAVTEAEAETAFNELIRTILNRYHEEQVWSDKIRSASTYGSLLALGVNIGVFVLAIIVVEPWKRRRLAQTFEKRIEQLELENREMLGKGMSNLSEHFEKQELVLAELAAVSMRGNLVDHEVTVQVMDGVEDPTLLIERTAKAARDRDMWIAGAAGAVGGGILTMMLGYFFR